MAADTFTKGLLEDQFEKSRRQLGYLRTNGQRGALYNNAIHQKLF